MLCDKYKSFSRKDSKSFCLGIVLIFICFQSYSNNEQTVTDSLIDWNVANANFTEAQKLIESEKNVRPSNNLRNALLTLKLSEVRLKQGETELALKALEEANALLSTVKNPEPELQFHYSLQRGRYLNFILKSKDALIWLHRAETQARNNTKISPRDMSRLYAQLGLSYKQRKDYTTSIRYLQIASSKRKGVSLLDQIATIHIKVDLANAYRLNLESEKAARLMDTCQNFAGTISEPLHPAMIEIYFALIDHCQRTDNIIIAEKLLQRAYHILNKSYSNEHYLYAVFYDNKSSIEFDKGDYERVLFYSNRVMDLTARYPFLSQYKESNFERLITVNCWYKKDYQKVIEICNRAIISSQNNKKSSVVFYFMLGASYYYLGNYQQATNYFEKVITLTSSGVSPKDLLTLSNTFWYYSLIASDQKKPEQVIEYLHKALSIAQKISPRHERVPYLYMEIGRNYYKNKQYNQAISFLQKSIIASSKTFSDTSFKANPEISDLISTGILNLYWIFSYKAISLYQLYEKDKENLSYLKSSLECQEIAVKLIERAVTDITNENSGVNTASQRVWTMNNAVSYAVLLYFRTNASSYAEKALEYAEKSKMQVLLIKTLNRNNLRLYGIPDSLIMHDEQLSNEILEIENQLALDEKMGKPQHSEVQLKKLTGLYDLRSELINRLDENYPAYYQAKYGFHVAGLKEIQKMLADDQVILEYQLLNSELITFVITSHDFNIHYQLIDHLVPENIQSLRNALASDPSLSDPDSLFRTFTASSQYLYGKLIGPVLDKIRGKRLIIIPHNDLTLIPFETLISRLPAGNQRPDYKSLNYLIKEFPMVYAYSANLLFNQEPDKKFGSGTAIFLPDYLSYNKPEDKLRFPELKGAGFEAAAIRKLSHGKLFNGKLAGETNFKTSADRYRILHIAAHTQLDEDNSSLSALVMTAPDDTTEDGHLYAYELSQLKLNAQLVVLSGCNTGYGKLSKGEGLISLARSFFYTGVRSLAYTLWPVSDKAGSELVSSFYSGLRNRESLDVAMRNAKLDFLERADPVKSHPFYWAGYVIVGRSENVKLGKFAQWPVYLMASIIGTILSVLLYRKFRT